MRISAPVLTLALLVLLVSPIQCRSGQTLGETITTIELDLRARPESTAAGPEATERFIAGLVAASIEVFE